MGHKIAIVGAGISGLGAAWALHRDHDITVFEARDRIGGHSNTVAIEGPRGVIPVDTGFIVYNERTYPHLTRLFAALDVPTQPSDMSFAFSLDREFEYGASLRGLTAQPSNLLRPRYRSMIRDIARFRRDGSGLLAVAGDESLGDLLTSHGYSEGFINDYLLPMAGAIWSARRSDIRRYPAAAMLRFLSNHGLIEIIGRPPWRTVTGGSREYVDRLTAGFRNRIRSGSPVLSVTRSPGEVTVETPSSSECFDHVVLATHSDQALRLLGDDASETETNALSAIPYEDNVAILHSDPALMPRRKAVWSSWNAMVSSDEREHRVASVTYWMNRLQAIDHNVPVFVSLNPSTQPDPALVHGTYRYAHPQFDRAAVEAQVELSWFQGRRNTWYAGAYHGYGFHEDGLQSGLNVAAALGSAPAWYHEVVPMSSAPAPRVTV